MGNNLNKERGKRDKRDVDWQLEMFFTGTTFGFVVNNNSNSIQMNLTKN